MRLWVASYPRSGNTFIRLILHQAFGIKSTSTYPSESDAMKARPWLVERIGFSEEETPDKWLAVKTHDGPVDDGPAIYIVRDGRAAIASYRHHIWDFTPERPDLPILIRGEMWPGSWTNHYAIWNPEERPNTLVLRYEEMLDAPESVCSKIEAFLKMGQVAAFEEQFDELHALEPALFRSASNAKNISEMEPYIQLFSDHHAPLMRKLGYYTSIE